MRLVFASHTWMGGPFVVGSHHLSVQLAAMGHQVLHLSTPVTPAHLLKAGNADASGRMRAWLHGGIVRRHGVIDYVPMSLFPWALVKKFVRSGRNPFLATMPGLRRALERLGFGQADALMVDQPRFVTLERLLNPAHLIYRATDLYAEMTDDAATASAERALAQRADALVATSEPVLSHLRHLAPDKPWLLLENGVEYDHFANSSPTVATPSSEIEAWMAPVVYVGALDERFDFSAIEALARGLPEVRILLVGPHSEDVRKRMAVHANILLPGARPYAALPAILQRATVGVLPLSDHPANKGRSPMKLYEYAAAGLPVVARHTPELSRRNQDFVHLYQSSDELVSLVDRLLKHPVDRRAVQAMALPHAWSTKAEMLLRMIQEGLKTAPAPGAPR